MNWSELGDMIIRVIREFKLAEWGPIGGILIIASILAYKWLDAWGKKKEK